MQARIASREKALRYDGTASGGAVNTYTWNARNQLTQITSGGATQMSYTYDALGRRISKAAQGGTPTQFLYDGANAVQETVGSTINPILVGLGVDERFARNDTTGRTYFLSDAINSTIALTSTTDAIQNQYSYDPYGNASQSGTGFTNPYQFMGREADTAGLYYYRARYYSPMMAGFISEDPAGFAGGQLSFYAGFGGDPIDFNDPYGLYRAVVVTLPNGAQYMPMTTVKNSAQADSYGVPIGTEVAIAVPDGINPQDMVNDWASTYWNGPAVFAWAWRPGGPNDYKLQKVGRPRVIGLQRNLQRFANTLGQTSLSATWQVQLQRHVDAPTAGLAKIYWSQRLIEQ